MMDLIHDTDDFSITSIALNREQAQWLFSMLSNPQLVVPIRIARVAAEVFAMVEQAADVTRRKDHAS